MCLLMAFTIVVGYTGIPVYKMICLEDGHTSISISEQDSECHHNLVKQDCCSPKHVQPKPAESCCAGASTFFKLHESTEVPFTLSSTGHVLFPITLFFAPQTAFIATNYTVATHQYGAPPLLAHKQPAQSIIQVFRI